MAAWAGVDVGGRRKGFHVAMITSSARSLRLCLLANVSGDEAPRGVAELLTPFAPRVVAVDSPREFARKGKKSRPCEDALNAAVGCGIRGTPDGSAINTRADDYYEWIEEGRRLYRALASEPSWTVVECFPTASWARLGSLRPSGVSRAVWSEKMLTAKLEKPGLLTGVPKRRNQDVRDAVVAAYTAYLYGWRRQQTETFTCLRCDIVVPR